MWDVPVWCCERTCHKEKVNPLLDGPSEYNGAVGLCNVPASKCRARMNRTCDKLAYCTWLGYEVAEEVNLVLHLLL